MHEFEIFFRDLSPEVQRELLAFAGIDRPGEMNWDTLPLASIPFPDEDSSLNKHTEKSALNGNLLFVLNPCECMPDASTLGVSSVYSLGESDAFSAVSRLRNALSYVGCSEALPGDALFAWQFYGKVYPYRGDGLFFLYNGRLFDFSQFCQMVRHGRPIYFVHRVFKIEF